MGRQTKNISISLDPDLYEIAKTRADAYGFGHSFSSYLSFLLRQEIASATSDAAGDFEGERDPIEKMATTSSILELKKEMAAAILAANPKAFDGLIPKPAAIPAPTPAVVSAGKGAAKAVPSKSPKLS